MAEREESWLLETFPYFELIRILTFYLDLDCWIVSPGPNRSWQEIRHHSRATWPVDFDARYGKTEERARFNEVQFERVFKDKRTVCGTFGGLSSFFVPIVKKGRVAGVLQSGVFLKEVPTRAELTRLWTGLTGQATFEFTPVFLQYVRSLLEAPLLEGALYRAVQLLLELYAGILAGEGDAAEACQRARQLKTKVFARHFPHRFWFDRAVRHNRFYPPTWWVDGRLTRWEREELGIQRLPTTVLAMMFFDSRSRQDDLDFMLEVYRFQRALFDFSKRLTGALACPLEDYGMLFFLSPEPGRSKTESKLEIREVANRIAAFVEEHFQAAVLTGASSAAHPGENLSEVFHQAIMALGFCQPLKQPLLFYEDLQPDLKAAKSPNPYDLSRQLAEVYSNGEVDKTDLARNHYIEEVLSQSAGRPESVRLHYWYALCQLAEAIRRRVPQVGGNLTQFSELLERQLRQAGTAADLTGIFEESIKRLLALALRPAEGGQQERMEAARKYIQENFQRNLKLEEVARANGFSVSVFCKGFKKSIGVGFSAYLRRLRIDHARKLLLSSQLSISQISQECGFNNPGYFFVVFKMVAGSTPQVYRDTAKWRVPNKA